MDERADAVRRAFEETPLAAVLLAMAGELSLPVWLTGGFVRDALLGRGGGRDLDLAVDGDPAQAAAAWATVTDGALVPLDPARGTWRVAIKGDDELFYWDFNGLRGPTIREDLRLRDFTINALALPLNAKGSARLVDPTGGLGDIDARLVRHTHAAAFDEDPLRKLRAYRFAAQLGFGIEPRTSKFLSGDLLPAVSGERVREELGALLRADDAAPWLVEIARGGLLASLWPDPGPDVPRLSRLEDLLRWPDLPSPLAAVLAAPSTHDLTQGVLLKLLCLCLPGGHAMIAGYPEARRRLTSTGRELVLGRKAVRFQGLALDALVRLEADGGILSKPEGPWLFFDEYGQGGLAGLVLRAALEAGEPDLARLAQMASFWADRYLPDLASPRLISADEVGRMSGLAPGPELGSLLARLKMAARLGQVSTPAQAASLLAEMLGRRA